MTIMEEKKQQFDIELNRDVAQGTYSNLSIISHSSSEFIIDFIRIMPGMPKAEVKSRIILTPEHAKRLLLALQDNVRRFEIDFGKINLPEGWPDGSHVPGGFGTAGTSLIILDFRFLSHNLKSKI